MNTKKNVQYDMSDLLQEKEICEVHGNLVKRIAHHLMGRLPSSVMVDDLIQAGMIGLIEAYRNFDNTKGASFETYAGIRIRGSMFDEIRKGDWAPRSVHRNTRRVAQAIREVENEKGRDAKDGEIAEKLGITLNDYYQVLLDSSNCRIMGFEDVGVNEETVKETLSDPIPTPLDRVLSENFKKNLAKGISMLPDRERLVLALYYEEDLNLREVGEVIGVSESRISQIHSQAMMRLQSRMRDWI